MNLDFPRRPILHGRVNFPLCLAPMVGLSHVALRSVARSYLPSSAVTIWPTEMLNSNRLPREDWTQTPETFRDSDEGPLVPQILGNAEEPIRKSVQLLEQWGAAGVDINMGCPVQKALRHNYGVSLMGDPDYARDVVAMTVASSSLPVSVKLRAGAQNDMDFLFRFVEGIECAGASWVTLHPRTPDQRRRGTADWKQIRELRARVGLPVIGNGDVQTADDVIKMLEQTGCDLVMAGRALAARPWMFWQVGHKLGSLSPDWTKGRCPPLTPEEEGAEYGRVLFQLWKNLRERHSLSLAFRKFRFHVRTTGVWLEFGHHLHAKTTKAKTEDELMDELAHFFSVTQVMYPKTQLRE